MNELRKKLTYFAFSFAWLPCVELFAMETSQTASASISDSAPAVLLYGEVSSTSLVEPAGAEMACAPEAACCPSGCCNPCPCTYAWADGLYLDRDNQSCDQPLVFDINTGDVLLFSGDLDFDWTGGVRLGAGQRMCCGLAWEVGYLGVFDHSASEVVVLEDSLILPGDLGLLVNNFAFADLAAFDYDSDIHSVELNLVSCCCHCACFDSVELFGGPRFVYLEEEFSIFAFDSEESSTTYRVTTDNYLYGAQVGARVRRCCGAWGWEATGKTGLYVNDAEQSQDPIIDFPDVEFRGATSASDTEVAFVGDFNLTGIYQIDCVWALRAGYNAIWLGGVALAPDQLDFSSRPDSGTRLVGGGAVFLHGLNVGIEARY